MVSAKILVPFVAFCDDFQNFLRYIAHDFPQYLRERKKQTHKKQNTETKNRKGNASFENKNPTKNIAHPHPRIRGALSYNNC
jgi:hypothetical protein